MKTKTFFLKVIVLFVLILSSAVHADENPANRASPPTTASGNVGDATLTINYGSPSVRGRKIWGELVPYEQIWRAGANEATTFETDKDIKIEGKTLPAGKYAFFAIPEKKKWTLIFNKSSDQWGAYKYEEKDDALRVKVSAKKIDALQEKLAYEIHQDGFVLKWEKIEVPVKVEAVAKK